jgi:esterase/lipase superfamily enzyme
MERQYHRWFSDRVHREMEVLVFGHGGDRVIVFPTRQGRFFDYENWGIVDAVRERIDAGAIQLFCVDSYDSWSLYDFGIPPWERITRHQRFEEYVLAEVVPFSEMLNASPRLVAHGCSIGAFHATNIAFRHPSRFARVVAFSGRYDLTQEYAWYRDLFSGYYDQTIYFHTPLHFIPNLTDAATLQQLRALEIRFAIGEQDYFVDSNRELSQALWDKGVWHAFDLWPGKAHAPWAWREMAARFL